MMTLSIISPNRTKTLPSSGCRISEKRHPEIVEWLVQIPCSRLQIPCSFAKIPCSVAQGILLDAYDFARLSAVIIFKFGPILQNSLFFSLLAGNMGMETGSTRTASAT
jgi:hypothetical protein